MYRLIPILVGGFILIGGLLSCDSNPPNTNCDTCINPCDTCDTTDPCDTCDTTKPAPNPDSLAHAFTWTEYKISGEANITGCWVFNDNKIYALGNSLYEFNGTSWDRLYLRANGNPIGSFADMHLFCFGESDYWIFQGNRAYHINDDQIYGIKYDFPTDGFINGCWGTSSKDMFFVGNWGAITHFDGTNWTKMPRVTSKHLTDVWGTSHNDVWAAGYNSETDDCVLLHYDGTEWKEDQFSSSGQMRQYGIGSVYCTDSAGHRVVAIAGTRVWRKTDNGPWRTDTSEIGNSLGGGQYIGIGIRGDTPNNMVVAGGWGMVSHWNGKTWHKYKELYDYSKPTYGAEGLSIKGNTICVVGGKSGSWIAIGRRKP